MDEGTPDLFEDDIQELREHQISEDPMQVSESIDVNQPEFNAESIVNIKDNEQPPDSLPENIISTDSVDKSNKAPTERNRLMRLPLARVKHIMKMDPDCAIVSQDAVIVAAKAVEMFLTHIGTMAGKFTLNNKRRTVLKRDLDAAIESEARLCFLDGALD